MTSQEAKYHSAFVVVQTAQENKKVIKNLYPILDLVAPLPILSGNYISMMQKTESL